MQQETLRDRIAAQLDLVDVISDYVRLTRSGKNLRGLCPFHADRRPSFTVSPDRGFWHCFGCQQGGDLFSFVMKIEGLTFSEALVALARRAGLPLEGWTGGGASERERLLVANEAAAEFFTACLQQPQAVPYRNYLDRRSISQDATSRFCLGCTPPSRDGLFWHLRGKQIPVRDMLDAGLCGRDEATGQFYDRFAGRLMFPVQDVTGRVVGFGGRVIDDRDPKYLNTAESPAFVKRNLLYGLNQAKAEIARLGTAILVEGYTDVIACHQAGIRHAVATLGTAVGEGHARLVRRYADSVVLAYDADSAGLAAVLRTQGHFEQVGVTLRVAALPPGSDPDQFVGSRGGDALLNLVSQAVPIADFRLNLALTGYEENGVEERRRALSEVAEVLSDLHNPVERQEYIARLGRVLSGAEPGRRAAVERALHEQVAVRLAGQETQVRSPEDVTGLPAGLFRAERAILGLMLREEDAGARIALRIGPEDFSDPGHRALAECLFARVQNGKRVGLQALAGWKDDPEVAEVAAAAVAACGEDPASVSEEATAQYLKVLEHERYRRRREALGPEVRQRLEEGTLRRTDPLYEEYGELCKYLAGSTSLLPDRATREEDEER